MFPQKNLARKGLSLNVFTTYPWSLTNMHVPRHGSRHLHRVPAIVGEFLPEFFRYTIFTQAHLLQLHDGTVHNFHTFNNLKKYTISKFSTTWRNTLLPNFQPEKYAISKLSTTWKIHDFLIFNNLIKYINFQILNNLKVKILCRDVYGIIFSPFSCSHMEYIPWIMHMICILLWFGRGWFQPYP